jgi:hypothetical protein
MEGMMGNPITEVTSFRTVRAGVRPCSKRAFKFAMSPRPLSPRPQFCTNEEGLSARSR